MLIQIYKKYVLKQISFYKYKMKFRKRKGIKKMESKL